MARKPFNLHNLLFTGKDPWDRDLDDATTFRGATKIGNDKREYGFRPHGTLRGPLVRVWAARQLSGIGLPFSPPLWLTLFTGFGVVAWDWNPKALLAAPIYLLLIGVAVAIVGLVYLRRRWKGRHTYRDIILPTAKTVARITGTKVGWTGARRMVEVPDDSSREIRIALPVGVPYTAAMQKQIETAVALTTGTPNATAEFHISKRHPYVLIRPTPPPPDEVYFRHIKPHLEKVEADIHHPIIGMAPGMRPVTIDYLNDSPHVLISGGSGTGKSVLVKGILAQRMHHGAGLVVLDFKRVSHLWAHDLPGCAYAWQIEDIHQLAVAVGEALQGRIGAPLEEYPHFRTVDVLVEEANSLMALLQQYWKSVKEPSDPIQSPAVAALQRVVFMGREMGIHGHWVSQRASTRVFGADGGDARENFTTRLMAKWTMQTWRMLCGGIPFRRWPGGGRGVWARVQDDDAEIVRTALWTDAECREWATTGESCLELPLEMGSVLTGGPATPKPVQEKPRALVTLSQWLPVQPNGDTAQLSLSNARKQSTRDPLFPKARDMVGPANLYDPAELDEWKRRRDDLRQANAGTMLPQHEQRSAGVVYAIDVDDPATGQTVLAYVGQTRQSVEERFAQHMETQPWSDLNPRLRDKPLWSGEPTAAELDSAELQCIHDLRPLFNFDGQEGATHAIPKWQAREERWARDDAVPRARWQPLSQSQWRSARLNAPSLS